MTHGPTFIDTINDETKPQRQLQALKKPTQSAARIFYLPSNQQQWLYKARMGEVPGLSHDMRIVFLEFAVKQTSL